MRRRYSVGLARADILSDSANRLKRQAEEAGATEAIDLADRAISCGFNARSGYEAAQMGDTGGSSEAWSLRKRGAMWQRKGNKLLDDAKEALAKARGEP